jgi:predicted Kef-type K+ transport protein
MSELVPGVVVLPAPIEVPLPVVVSVLLPVVPVVPEVLAVLLEVSLGVVVVDGVVLDVVDEVLEASSCLLQALRDRAAIRARAAHCAIGDLIIRELLEGLYRVNRER